MKGQTPETPKTRRFLHYEDTGQSLGHDGQPEKLSRPLPENTTRLGARSPDGNATKSRCPRGRLGRATPRLRAVRLLQDPLRARHDARTTSRGVSVGCICAGVMEGDILAAKERERLMRNRSSGNAASRNANGTRLRWLRPHRHGEQILIGHSRHNPERGGSTADNASDLQGQADHELPLRSLRRIQPRRPSSGGREPRRITPGRGKPTPRGGDAMKAKADRSSSRQRGRVWRHRAEIHVTRLWNTRPDHPAAGRMAPQAQGSKEAKKTADSPAPAPAAAGFGFTSSTAQNRSE